MTSNRGWTTLSPFTDHIEIKNYVGNTKKGRDWRTSLEGKFGYFSTADGCWPVSKGLLDWEEKKAPVCGLYFLRVDVGEGDLDREKGSRPRYFDYIGMATGMGNYPNFQKGIFGRMMDHYGKLTCLPSRGAFNKLIQKYQFNVVEANQQKENRAAAVELLRDQKFVDYSDLRSFFNAPVIDYSESSTVGEYGTTKNFQECFEISSNNYDLNTSSGIREFFTKNVKVSFLIVDGAETSKKYVEKVAKGEGLALAAYEKRFGEVPRLNQRNEVYNFFSLPEAIED